MERKTVMRNRYSLACSERQQEKADRVNRTAQQASKERLVSMGVHPTIVGIFERSAIPVWATDAEALGTMTSEQRCAALGMEVEGHPARSIARYLIDACHDNVRNASRTVAPPVPALPGLGGGASSEPARSTGASSGVAPFRRTNTSGPVPNTGGGATTIGGNNSTVGSRTPRRSHHHADPYSSGFHSYQRSPSSTSNTSTNSRSYHQAAVEEQRHRRSEKSEELSAKRMQLARRQSYHRERSLSPGPNIHNGEQHGDASVWKRLQTPTRDHKRSVWQERDLSAAREERKAMKPFAATNHRNSYLSAPTRSEIHKSVMESTLESAAHLQKQASILMSRKKGMTPPPKVARVSRPVTPVKATANNNVEPSPAPTINESEPSPAPRSPRLASPSKSHPTERGTKFTESVGGELISSTRVRKMIDDFRSKLSGNRVTVAQWRNMSRDRQEELFDVWRCNAMQRQIVNDHL